MADKTDNMMQEYLMLQGKVDKYKNYDHTLWALAITATATILGFCITTRKTDLFILPLLMITSIMASMAVIKQNIIKIESYLIVLLEPKLEGVKFETRNFMLREKITIIFSIIKYIFLLLVVVGFGGVYCYNQSNLNYVISAAAVMFIAFLLCFYISWLEAGKKEWIEKWKKREKQIESGQLQPTMIERMKNHLKRKK